MYNANILKRKEAAAAKPLRPPDRLFRGRGRSVLPLLLLLLLLSLLLLQQFYCVATTVHIICIYYIYFRFSFAYSAASVRSRPLTERPQYYALSFAAAAAISVT
jgi:hypothetical protein